MLETIFLHSGQMATLLRPPRRVCILRRSRERSIECPSSSPAILPHRNSRRKLLVRSRAIEPNRIRAPEIISSSVLVHFWESRLMSSRVKLMPLLLGAVLILFGRAAPAPAALLAYEG